MATVRYSWLSQVMEPEAKVDAEQLQRHFESKTDAGAENNAALKVQAVARGRNARKELKHGAETKRSGNATGAAGPAAGSLRVTTATRAAPTDDGDRDDEAAGAAGSNERQEQQQSKVPGSFHQAMLSVGQKPQMPLSPFSKQAVDTWNTSKESSKESKTSPSAGSGTHNTTNKNTTTTNNNTNNNGSSSNNNNNNKAAVDQKDSSVPGPSGCGDDQ